MDKILTYLAILLVFGVFFIFFAVVSHYELKLADQDRALQTALTETDNLTRQVKEYQGRTYLDALTPLDATVNTYDVLRAMSRMFRELEHCEIHFTVKGGE